MNVFDLIAMYKDKTEDELKNMEIQGLWEIDHVESCMDEQGIPRDEFTLDEKRKILHDAIDGYGDANQDDINDAIYDAVEDLHDLKMNK